MIFGDDKHFHLSIIRSQVKTFSQSIFKAVTMCPAPGQIAIILCVRRAATSQPGRIAANLFVRRPEKYEAVTAYFALFVRRVSK